MQVADNQKFDIFNNPSCDKSNMGNFVVCYNLLLNINLKKLLEGEQNTLCGLTFIALKKLFFNLSLKITFISPGYSHSTPTLSSLFRSCCYDPSLMDLTFFRADHRQK